MGKLEHKVAVITGAASGIGRATAIRFAGEGAAVVIADMNREGGEAAVRDCKENGGPAVFQLADVSHEEDLKGSIDRAVKEFGRLDVIYNNAGLGGAVGPLENTSAENWDRSFAILLRAVFLGIKHAVPEMRKAGGGSIISTASIAGLRGAAGLHAYCAAKAGVISLTRSASIELAKDKIRVNCICPGLIATPLTYNRIPGGEQVATQLFAGFRISLAHAFIVLFAAELIGSHGGLGALIAEGEDAARFDLMFAAIVAFAILGFVSDCILMAVRARVLKGTILGTEERVAA